MRLVSLVLLAAGTLAAALLPRAFGHPWLAALFFWSGVPVGAIGYLCIMVLVGGEWRRQLAPALLALSATLPLIAAAALPLLLAMGALYPWVAHPPEGFAGAWLSPVPFAIRTILWFAGLAAVPLGLNRRSTWAKPIACAGLLFLIPMGSLIAVDWLLSLDPAFHSSGFGLQALSIQFTVALMVAVLLSLRAGADRGGTVGALMLTLLLFWGYFAYLPFFIVWSGDTPAGAGWYLARSVSGWGFIAGLSVALHMLPLLALLFGPVRRDARTLAACAAASLVGDALQSAWLVLPADGPVTPLPAAAFLLALALIGAPMLLAARR